MNEIMDLHYHPTLMVVVTDDDRVFRETDEGGIIPVEIVMVGKNGRPYPAANVRKADGEWTFTTLARLVHEARTGQVLSGDDDAHHGAGREKGDYRFGATSPLDRVAHGRESRAKQLGEKEE